MKSVIKKKLAHSIKRYPILFDIIKLISRLFDKNEIFHLLQEYNRSKNEISVLQIGANDGMTNDPVREFIVRYKKWHGHLVEPIPTHFAELKKNYRYISSNRVKFLKYGVSDKKDSIPIYQIKEEFIHQFPQYAQQIASLNKSHLIAHFPSLKHDDEKIEPLEIPVITIQELIDQYHIEHFDILCLDTEGLEYRIIMSFPFETTRPSILIYETLHLTPREKNSLYDHLKNKGYENYQFHFDSISLLDNTCSKWKLKYQAYKN